MTLAAYMKGPLGPSVNREKGTESHWIIPKSNKTFWYYDMQVSKICSRNINTNIMNMYNATSSSIRRASFLRFHLTGDGFYEKMLDRSQPTGIQWILICHERVLEEHSFHCESAMSDGTRCQKPPIGGSNLWSVVRFIIVFRLLLERVNIDEITHCSIFFLSLWQYRDFFIHNCYGCTLLKWFSCHQDVYLLGRSFYWNICHLYW